MRWGNFLVKHKASCKKCFALDFRWIGWSLNCTGSLATMIAALLAASGSDSLTAGMAGLSVYYAQWVRKDIKSINDHKL